MLKRRHFLAAAAAAPLPAFAQDAHPTCLPAYGQIKTRAAGKIEILYKTKHGQPNGLALTDNPGQMWIVDQGAEHWISLIDIKSGDTLRECRAWQREQARVGDLGGAWRQARCRRRCRGSWAIERRPRG